jgi:hypothetical protein
LRGGDFAVQPRKLLVDQGALAQQLLQTIGHACNVNLTHLPSARTKKTQPAKAAFFAKN